jgi:hypothetical protein
VVLSCISVIKRLLMMAGASPQAVSLAGEIGFHKAVYLAAAALKNA